MDTKPVKILVKKLDVWLPNDEYEGEYDLTTYDAVGKKDASNGYLLDNQKTRYTTFEYDKKGNNTGEYTELTNEGYHQGFERKYDSSNRLIEETYYCGSLAYVATYENNAAGDPVKVSMDFNGNGSVDNYTTHTYDKNGKVTRDEEYDLSSGNAELYDYTTYEYNDKGNLTKKALYSVDTSRAETSENPDAQDGETGGTYVPNPDYEGGDNGGTTSATDTPSTSSDLAAVSGGKGLVCTPLANGTQGNLSLTTVYTYDAQNRLIDEKTSFTDNSATEEKKYTYTSDKGTAVAAEKSYVSGKLYESVFYQYDFSDPNKPLLDFDTYYAMYSKDSDYAYSCESGVRDDTENLETYIDKLNEGSNKWTGSIDELYSELLQKTSGEEHDKIAADQSAWNKNKEADLQKKLSQYTGDGIETSYDIAKASYEFYRDKARTLAQQLYEYDQTFWGSILSSPEAQTAGQTESPAASEQTTPEATMTEAPAA